MSSAELRCRAADRAGLAVPGRDPRAAGCAPAPARRRGGVRPRRRGDARARGDDDPDGRARLVRQRGVVRRLCVRAAARLDGLRDSISLTVYYGAELDMSGCTALALSQSGRTPDVVEYARRAKPPRRLRRRGHERPRVRARSRGRRRARARRGAGARGRGDEDVLQPGRGARPARRPRRRRGRRFADGSCDRRRRR